MTSKELVLTPAEAFDEASFIPVLYNKLSIPRDGSLVVVPRKRSVDARGRDVKVRVQYDLVERTMNQQCRRIGAIQVSDCARSRSRPRTLRRGAPEIALLR